MRAIPPRGNRCEGSLNLAALQNTAAWLISRKTFKLKNLVFHRKINHADVLSVLSSKARKAAPKMGSQPLRLGKLIISHKLRLERAKRYFRIWYQVWLIFLEHASRLTRHMPISS